MQQGFDRRRGGRAFGQEEQHVQKYGAKRECRQNRNKLLELFTGPRNRVTVEEVGGLEELWGMRPGRLSGAGLWKAWLQGLVRQRECE